MEHDPVTGQPLMLRTSSGIESLYVFDGTGNPAALITDYATQAYVYSFDPYGTAVLTAGGGRGGEQQNPYLFKGGIQDRTTGWVHFGARWYNPTTGRFTQQDALDTPLNPANANRYAYDAGDPANGFDPTGRIDCLSASILAVGGTAATAAFAAGSGALALAYAAPFAFFGVVSALDTCDKQYS